MPALGTDEGDVVLCVLTAACYDNQVRRLPAMGCEPDETKDVRQEGWIYFPKYVLRDRAGGDSDLPSRFGYASRARHG